jgi:membrane protease YdiL (CAAX protease family)
MENKTGRWRVFGRVLLFFIACAALLAIAAAIERQFAGLPTGMLTGAVTSVGTLLLTAVFVRWEGLRLEDVGAAITRRSPTRFAIGFILGLLLVALHMAIVGFVGHTRWARTQGVGFPDIATSLIIYFLLSCREELAFRGYPLRRLHQLFGLWAAQSVVALAFAIEHVGGGSTWENALFGAGVGSLLFGMAAIATRGLAVPIGLHAAWNFGDWMRGGKGSGGLWHPVGAEAFRDRADLVGMIGYFTVMLSATLTFWWVYRRALDKTEARRVR